MRKPAAHTPQKWRPSLSMIVTAMLIFVLALPLGGIWLFRFYDNQLVRETEQELIIQGAFIKAIVKQELEKRAPNLTEFPNALHKRNSAYPSLGQVEPTLDLTTSPQFPDREAALPVQAQANKHLAAIGQELNFITQDAQKTTLAGFRILDANGIVVAGRNEMGLSLAHVEEIRTALEGRYASVLRARLSKTPRPPIYSISRGTAIRVFVAMPLEFQGRVAGVAYLSRTPSHFLRELYDQRWKLAGAAFFMLLMTLMIAIIFVRAIKGPIDMLNDRMKRIANGDRSAIAPLPRHGTQEIAELADGLFSMSEKLQDRSDYIRTFANHVSHELKSPLTSIQGAAELMKDSGATMSPEQRDQFLDNIMEDTNRSSKLLIRLRDLAATEAPVSSQATSLENVLNNVQPLNPKLRLIKKEIPTEQIAISEENLCIVLENLLENSAKHNASEVHISGKVADDFLVLSLEDNGSGISKANMDKIFDVFFTTRRDKGGTGMGLNIVQSMLHTHGGDIHFLASEQGAHFELTIPLTS